MTIITNSKKWLLLSGLAFTLAVCVFSCKKADLSTGSNDSTPAELTAKGSTVSNSNNCDAYNVTAVANYNASTNQTTFTWTITNTNVGNGTNGTAKDLSHWDFTLCERARLNLVSASNGIGQMVTPTYMIDPSMSCATDSVLKFDYGTSGSIPTTYTLILSGNFSVDNSATGFFKAGTNCCARTFPGISCTIITPICALSQGYWFANTAHSWNNQTVTIGGNTYTQAEGQALWSALPGGSGGNATRVFYQASAIMLSLAPASRTAALNNDLAAIDAFLTGLGKLSASNHPNISSAAATAAGAAADDISTFITNNECTSGGSQ